MYRSKIFFDYESFSINPKGPMSQFAAVHTIDSEVVGTHNVFCKPTPDVLPSLMSCLITGITPQHAYENGLPEYEFANYINDLFLSTPQTLHVGYNSQRFDDVATQFTLYRNGLPPYKWAYHDGNKCADLLPILRFFHAFEPDILTWPTATYENDKGENVERTSFKLEEIAPANGLMHEKAHDALSDTIVLKDLFELVESRASNVAMSALIERTKWDIKSILSQHMSAGEPITMYHTRFFEQNYVGQALVLGSNAKGDTFYLWDLNVALGDFCTDGNIVGHEDNLIGSYKETGIRSGLFSVKINKSPLIANGIYQDQGMLLMSADMDTLEQNFEIFDKYPEIMNSLSTLIENRVWPEEPTCVNTNLYTPEGGFYSRDEERVLGDFHDAESWEARKATLTRSETTERASKLMGRVLLKNAPEVQTEAALAKFKEHYVIPRIKGELPDSFTSINDLEADKQEALADERFDEEQVDKMVTAIEGWVLNSTGLRVDQLTTQAD